MGGKIRGKRGPQGVGWGAEQKGSEVGGSEGAAHLHGDLFQIQSD